MREHLFRDRDQSVQVGSPGALGERFCVAFLGPQMDGWPRTLAPHSSGEQKSGMEESAGPWSLRSLQGRVLACPSQLPVLASNLWCSPACGSRVPNFFLHLHMVGVPLYISVSPRGFFMRLQVIGSSTPSSQRTTSTEILFSNNV